MKIKLIKFREDLIEPVRKHYNDAGADVHIQERIHIREGETIKIPLGFGIELPDGFVAYVCDRSSVAMDGLSCHLSPIDAGYRGEIHAIMTNNTNSLLVLEKGTRIAQLVILPTIYGEFVEAFDTEERGQGGFGSTGGKKITDGYDD